MRTFIAVELDAAAREAVAALEGRVARSVGDVRWVRPENVHITLRFLGETAPGTRALVERALDEVAAAVAPFGVCLGGLGAFPSLKRPRVLWVGIGEGSGELVRVHSMIGERLEAGGIPREERAFTPHVTVGRLRRPASGGRLAAVARNSHLGSRFVADRIAFVESNLTPKGAVYTTLFEAPLRGARVDAAGDGTPDGK